MFSVVASPRGSSLAVCQFPQLGETTALLLYQQHSKFDYQTFILACFDLPFWESSQIQDLRLYVERNL